MDFWDEKYIDKGEKITIVVIVIFSLGDKNMDELQILKEENRRLRFELDLFKLMSHRRRNGDESLYGFKLTDHTVRNQAGKEYRKVYAYNFIGGKQIWVYVGTRDKAREKIKSWLEKNLDRLKEKCEKVI